jgi:predicted transcriptional regulator
MKEGFQMSDKTLGAVEARFADIIWQREPISSGELVRLCEQELNWKKSTTYTVLRRLCEREIFQNTDGVVTSLISKKEFYAQKSTSFVEEHFSGSLPAFFAAFTARKKLSAKEIAELELLIERSREEDA